MMKEARLGLETAWITRGTGPHPALFLHCSLASSRSLAPLMEELDGIVEAVAPDLPGHGDSGDWDGSGDFVGRSAEMAATFCGAPRDVVGHSLGAVTSLTMLARNPSLARRAVLIEPVFFAAAKGTEAHTDHIARHGEMADALDRGDRDDATRIFTDVWGTGQPWASIPPAQRAAMADRIHLIPATEPALEQDANDLLSDGTLEAITLPVLLIRGETTHPVIADIHETLRNRLPDVTEAVVPGAGHMSPITHVPVVKELVHDHIRRRNE